MAETYATAEECQRLYDLMAPIKDMAPWNWMEEVDVFGVQNPDTGKLGFVSVMGMAGEHFAIAVYLGAHGLYGFWGFQEKGPMMRPEDILEIPQLQASFEDRNELRKEDRDLIKALGLKYRGQKAWPLFRSYRPGCYPWFVDAAEARFLEYALEQTLDVAPRFKADPALLSGEDEDLYLVRTPRREGDNVTWSDSYTAVPPPPPSEIQIMMDMNLLNAAKKMPKGRHRLEADFYMMPTIIHERGERPYFPYMLMLVEARSGYVLGSDLMQPLPSMEEMWGQLPLTVLQQIARLGAIPAEIHVRSEVLFHMLQHLGEELGFKLKQTRRLPQLDTARRHLERYTRRFR